MEYYVIGPDGQQYGPANVETLKAWVQDARVHPATMLKNTSTGQVVPASSVPGLFATAPPPPQSAPPASYPRPSQATSATKNADGASDLWAALIRCAIALVIFYFIRAGGLVMSAYGLYYAIQSLQKGHRFGVVAVVIASITLLIVIAGYATRFGYAGQPTTYR